jgi:beta-fructofuranosidase
VIAHARSADMRVWELQPPLSEPAGFGQLEVPQVRVIDGRPVLVFTCGVEEQSVRQKARWGEFCTWCVTGESVLGPWDVAAARPFRAEPDLFAAPLVQTRAGGWVFVGFRNLEPKGSEALEILDPIPVRLVGGELV